jgi:hypothetical protein
MFKIGDKVSIKDKCWTYSDMFFYVARIYKNGDLKLRNAEKNGTFDTLERFKEKDLVRGWAAAERNRKYH